MTDTIEPQEPVNITAAKILDSAFKIHRQYGPGLLENAYQHLLLHELVKNQNMKVEPQKILPLFHEGEKIDAGYRLDLVVNQSVIVELKAVEKLLPVHQAQILTYLKLSGMKLGLLINFNEKLLKNGIKRMIL